MAQEMPLYMPKMSMTMETGELVGWMMREGDSIKPGDIVAEVTTDKVDMEVEAPFGGTLVRIVASPGDTVPVGEPIGFILTESEDLMAGLFDPPPDVASAPESPNSDAAPGDGPDPGAVVKDEPAVATRRGPIPTVPLARRRATELGVSLDDVIPTGSNGLITVPDVELAARKLSNGGSTTAQPAAQPTAQPTAAAETPATADPATTSTVASTPAAPVAAAPVAAPSNAPRPAPATSNGSAGSTESTDPGFADVLAPRRKAIRSAVARTMIASATVPQFTIFAELNLETISHLRNKVGWTTLLIRALARALRNNPQVNAGWDESAGAPAAPKDSVGVSLATDSAVGLLAPVIHDPDLLSLQDQDALVRATINRARTGKLSAADMQGGTTTLSNLGGFGVPSFTSLLTPPQATALSVGAITQRPVVVGGGLVVRLGTTVGLTLDHRPVDGADGARLLADIQALFNAPDTLLG